MLNVDNLHAFYGKSHVLHGVSLNVQPGEIVSLLGRNGSGRSTTPSAPSSSSSSVARSTAVSTAARRSLCGPGVATGRA